MYFQAGAKEQGTKKSKSSKLSCGTVQQFPMDAVKQPAPPPSIECLNAEVKMENSMAGRQWDKCTPGGCSPRLAIKGKTTGMEKWKKAPSEELKSKWKMSQFVLRHRCIKESMERAD